MHPNEKGSVETLKVLEMKARIDFRAFIAWFYAKKSSVLSKTFRGIGAKVALRSGWIWRSSRWATDLAIRRERLVSLFPQCL
jgi:hypothetical protein